MHLQIDFIIATASATKANALSTTVSADLAATTSSGFLARFNLVSSVDATQVDIAGSVQVAVLTESPTTSTPTFNVDSTLISLEMKYVSSGQVIQFHQAGSSTEVFKPTWYSYGTTTLTSTNESAIINLSFVPAYSDSKVSVRKDNLDLGIFTSSVTISLDPGTQSTFVLIVMNQDSGVTLKYDLTVVRPHADCSVDQLSPW